MSDNVSLFLINLHIQLCWKTPTVLANAMDQVVEFEATEKSSPC
jgi:hypothetical protein